MLHQHPERREARLVPGAVRGAGTLAVGTVVPGPPQRVVGTPGGTLQAREAFEQGDPGPPGRHPAAVDVAPGLDEGREPGGLRRP